MSSVMRPSGPLPPRVYWLRRVVTFGLVLLVALAIWWLLGRVLGGGDQAQAAQQGSSAPPSGDNAGAATTRTASSDHSGPGSGGRHRQGRQHTHHRGKPARTSASPSGPCSAHDVAMTVVAPDVGSGHANVIRLQLTSTTAAACTLAITPDTLALRIISGQDLIWSSDSCPNQLPARQVVVRRHPATVYSFSWDGHRSSGSCRRTGDVAKPGGYWAEAALIGGGVHKAYFDVT